MAAERLSMRKVRDVLQGQAHAWDELQAGQRNDEPHGGRRKAPCKITIGLRPGG